MAFLPYGSLLCVALIVAGKEPDLPMMDQLTAEAEREQGKHPEQWKRYQEQADKVFADSARVAAQWRKRSAPPRPDLTPLKLPLSFLMAALRKEEPKLGQAGKAARGESPELRHHTYLMAIVHSADERRIPALLEYRDHYRRLWPGDKYRYPWGKIIAEAATVKWASQRIRELVKDNPPLDRSWPANDLLFCLIERFAPQLPADVARAAYDYLRTPARERLASHDDQVLWEVLFRLDASRARKDILALFARPKGFLHNNAYVVGLLFHHAGPSPEVAAAVRRWLETVTDLDDYHKRQLRVVLLRADPDRELQPTVKYIDRLLAEQKRKNARFEFGGDVHGLVLALADVRTRAADDQLARYTFERAIDVGIRFLLLEALVRHHDSRAPELAARWLAEEPEHMQRWLKEQAAQKWGAHGRDVLKKAEELNKRKTP